MHLVGCNLRRERMGDVERKMPPMEPRVITGNEAHSSERAVSRSVGAVLVLV